LVLPDKVKVAVCPSLVMSSAAEIDRDPAAETVSLKPLTIRKFSAVVIVMSRLPDAGTVPDIVTG
jgi:hypothetical protein